MAARDRFVIVENRASPKTVLAALVVALAGLLIGILDLLPFPFGSLGRWVLIVTGALGLLIAMAAAGRAIQGGEALVGGPGWLQRIDPWWAHKVLRGTRLEGEILEATFEARPSNPFPGTWMDLQITSFTIVTNLGSVSTSGSTPEEQAQANFDAWLAAQPQTRPRD